MSKDYPEIDEHMRDWISRQHVFFVATAPLSGEGLINCSPKGLDSLRVLDGRTIAYVDVGGSGIETVAHIKENGRVTVMMCAFDGPPNIVRFYGRGRSVEPGDADFEALLARFPPVPSVRNIVVIEVDRIRDSCGYGVPLYEFKKDRNSLDNYFRGKTEDDLRAYRMRKNRESLDGLPGLDLPSD